MSAQDWVEHDPDGFPAGTIIEHIAPTCTPVGDVYVQPACTEWTQVIVIPMTELPATGSDVSGMVLLVLVLVVGGAVAWGVDKVKGRSR